MLNLNEIIDFLASHDRNRWLEVNTFRIYVRKSFKLIDGKSVIAFDIANIEQDGEREKGQFRQFIIDLKELLKTHSAATYLGANEINGIYIENVLNDRLQKSLPSMGFKLIDEVNQCFYQTLNREKSNV